jgi:hypothetical protein
MSIKVRVAPTQPISTGLSDVNRIRLSSPEFEFKPSITLDDLTDVTTAGAKDEDILVFSRSTRQFTPTESTDLISLETVSGGVF